MLEPGRMWIVIAVLAGLALGIHWLRQPVHNPSTEPTALVTVKDAKGVRTEAVTRSQCMAEARRVWIALEDGAECIAYVAPQGASTGETAVLFFEGDVGDEDATPEHSEKMAAGYQRRVAEAHSRFGVPFIVVARPGLMGSSGFHLRGGRRDEGEAMSRVIDALKQRYGFHRLVLAGQSGGARIVAQLLVLGRGDVLCAVMGSGAYGVPSTTGGGQVRTNIFGEPGRKYLVPMHHAGDIVHAAGRRAFVIGDARDTRTPFAGQRAWADKMRALGHHAVLIEAVAQGAEHHGLNAVSLQVAGMCAQGASDHEIAAFAAAHNKARGAARP